MSQRSYNDLLLDPNFSRYSYSGRVGALATGDVGQEIDGMRIHIIKEVGDNVYLIDSSKDWAVLLQMDSVHTESYRLPETREDVLDILLYEKPAVLRPDAITKLVINRTKSATKFPEGWDPLDKYPDSGSYADGKTTDKDGNTRPELTEEEPDDTTLVPGGTPPSN
jgi:hypothetical protein